MRAVHRGLLRRGRRLDRRGVTDVPLELLIIVIILAIVIPIILAALVTYTTDQEILSASEQETDLANTAIQAFDDGINTTLAVTLTLPGNTILTVGGSIFINGGAHNVAAEEIIYQVNGHSPYASFVENGAQDIALTNVTCSGTWPHVTFNYYPWTVGPGTTHLAVTKLAPGAFICGVPAPTNDTTGFVEVQEIP